MKARDLITRTALITTAWANGTSVERALVTQHSRDGISTAHKPIFVGGIIVAVTFLGFGLWAAIAPIGSAAIAPGAIAVESGRQTIQHLEGGIVKEIRVQEGTEVKSGDVLIRLDGTRARAELGLVQGQADLAEATRARLVAERDGMAKPEYPAELLARTKDPAVAEIVAGQSNLFAAREAVQTGQKSILQQQIAQYQKQIVGYQAIEVSKRSQLALVKEELGDLSSLLDEGIVTKSRVIQLKQQDAQLEGERGQSMAEISRAEQGIGEANRQILQIDKQHQEDVSKDLHATEGQLDDARQRLIAAADVVNRLDIVSPMDGTVVNLNVHTIGGVISPGSPLLELVPANQKLIVDAEINPRDITAIHVGQEVSVRVTTSEGRLTPVIYGKLEEISEDRVVTQNGRGAYKVRITIPPSEIARLGQVKLYVGMPVEALINSGSQSALRYAVKPLLDSLSKSFRER